jgi:hypothetical protein
MTKSRLSILIVGFAIVAVWLSSAACRKETPAETGTGAAAVSADQAVVRADEEKNRGWIEVKGADFIGHEVRKAGTGDKVAVVDSIQSTLPLPAGIYDVGFGATFLKGVEVKAGETTVLDPGGLTLNHATLDGHDVVAAGTGRVQGTVSATNSHIVLLPGIYAVKFGPLSWTVEIAAGKTTLVDPGIIEVAGADIQGHKIYDASGVVVGDVGSTRNSLPLPPGTYSIDLDGQRISFTLETGKVVKLER